MTIHLDHTIVPSRNQIASAKLLAEILSVPWAEGPAWSGVGRYLVWSDIPNNEVLRWNEDDGHVSRQHRFPSGNANGNTFDFQGRQISFCHGSRKVIRYEWNGEVTVLADNAPNGQETNAPNDGA